MRRNKVGPQAIESFKEILKFNKILTFIDISGNCIGNEGLEFLCEGLKQNKTILSLKIAQNDITSSGCEILRESLIGSKIQHLDISWNKIGNVGLDKLKIVFMDNLAPITYLDLHEIKVDQFYISKFYQALQRNSTI